MTDPRRRWSSFTPRPLLVVVTILPPRHDGRQASVAHHGGWFGWPPFATIR
jgi:hypothetical protein